MLLCHVVESPAHMPRTYCLIPLDNEWNTVYSYCHHALSQVCSYDASDPCRIINDLLLLPPCKLSSSCLCAWHFLLFYLLWSKTFCTGRALPKGISAKPWGPLRSQSFHPIILGPDRSKPQVSKKIIRTLKTLHTKTPYRP